MNNVQLIGRYVKDADIRQTNDTTIARFTLAVDRKYKKGEADFISCVAFGKLAEVISKYCHKGIKVAVAGRIQTGSYTNKDGQKVYTTDVIVEEQEFCEKKGESVPAEQPAKDEGFMDIPGDISDEVPWSDDIPFGN